MPLGASSVGKEAFKCVLAERWEGDNGIKERSSRFGCATGMEIAGGPRNIVFSTFAETNEQKSPSNGWNNIIIDVVRIGVGIGITGGPTFAVHEGVTSSDILLKVSSNPVLHSRYGVLIHEPHILNGT